MTPMVAFVSIALPALAALVLGPRGKTRWKMVLFMLIVTAVSNLGAMAVRRACGQYWTIYEYTLTNALIASAATLLGTVIVRHHPGKAEVLKILCFGCVAVAIYSTLTYGQSFITSDCATATLLAESQIKHRALFPASWNYANGSLWTIGNSSTFTLPFMLLLKNQSQARMLGSVLFYLVVSLGIVYLFRKMLKSEGWVLAIPLFLVFLAGGESFMVLDEAAYAGDMLNLVLGVTLLYCAVMTRRWIYILLYALLALMKCAGGSRFIAEQTIPLWGAYVFMAYLEERNNECILWKKRLPELSLVTALVIVPSVAGLVAYRWLCSWHNVNNTVNNAMVFADSLSTCRDNLFTSLLNLFGCFGFKGGVNVFTVAGMGNLVSMLSCVLVCFIVPVLQAGRIRSESQPVQFFFVFGMFHNAILLMTTTFFSLITPRYMLSSVFVNIVISARYIYAYWIEGRNFRHRVWTVLFSMAAISECLLLLTDCVGWEGNMLAQKDLTHVLVEHGLEKGYASYWNAYKYEIYSDLKIDFGAVFIDESNVAPFCWLVDQDVFRPDASRSFLMLQSSEDEKIGARIPARFGTPTETFQAHGYQVYVFDHDIAADFDISLEDGVLRPLELKHNESTNLEDDALILSQNGIVYGPYLPLKTGVYRITFTGDHLNDAVCDVYSVSNSSDFTFTEISRSEDSIRLTLSLFKDVEDVEFRLFNNTDYKMISLRKILVESVNN